MKVIMYAPEPTDNTSLQAFLGHIEFYIIFLNGRAMVDVTLHKLFEKNIPWRWQCQKREAFQALKKLVRDATVVARYDEDKTLIFSCDAPSHRVGAVLAQIDSQCRETLIAFASGSLGPAEKNYSQLDKEGLAIVFPVGHFHQYILVDK